MIESTTPHPTRDVLGFRLKIGVLAPSTNTIVQPEMDGMRPSGVTNHFSRIYTPNASAVSDQAFMAGSQVIADGVLPALESVLTCEPGWIICGVSAISFYGGLTGANRFQRTLDEAAGIGVSIGSLVITAALSALGGIRRIGLLTPFHPAANEQVRRFFTESDIEVRRDVSLRCRSWTAIAEVPEAVLIGHLRELDGDDIDAVVQVGTNLCSARLAGEAERWLGKPVIAVNTATYWHALRSAGITDAVAGFGRLLAER